MYQDPRAGINFCGLHYTYHRGDTGKWQRSSLLIRDGRWKSALPLMQAKLFSAPSPHVARRKETHPLAYEVLIGSRCRADHFTRAVATCSRWKRNREKFLQHFRPNFPVDRIDAHRVDFHQNLTSSRRRRRYPSEASKHSVHHTRHIEQQEHCLLSVMCIFLDRILCRPAISLESHSSVSNRHLLEIVR